jgi:hypothetical protein
MRNNLAIFLVAGTLSLLAQSASAEIVDIGKHDAGAVKNACDKAGGSFHFVRNQSGGTDYTCVKHNCDGNGGICQVYCTSDTCTGATPGRATPPAGRYDLVKILKFSPALPPRGGLLEPGRGAAPHGPSGLGTPKPTAPPTGKLY